MVAELEEQLIERLREAYAMESSVYEALNEMAAEAGDAEMTRMLETHKRDAWHHRQRLIERLEAHGESAMRKRLHLSGNGDASGSERLLDSLPFTPRRFRRLLKGLSLTSNNGDGSSGDGDRPRELVQEGAAAVQLKLVTYDVLERTAERAGDDQTAAVARRNRAGEEELAHTIASNPERFAERLEADESDA